MTARYLIDTDICIYILKRRSPDLMARFDRLKSGEAVISAIAYGELVFGAKKSRSYEAAMKNLSALTTIATVEPLPAHAAEHYAEIRKAHEETGRPIGANDLWLAAHALAARLVLVTNNEDEFSRVEGLTVQNWAK